MREAQFESHKVREPSHIRCINLAGVSSGRFCMWDEGKGERDSAARTENDTTNVCQPVGGAEDKQLMVISESRQF